MRSANPALNKNVFAEFSGAQTAGAAAGSGQAASGSGAVSGAAAGLMTLNGTVNKTGILLLLLIASAAHVWNLFMESNGTASMTPWMIGGGIGGLVLAIATIFKKQWAPITAPLYAVAEGLMLGGLSAMFETMYPGIVMQAVSLTFAVLVSLLLAYRSGLIRATENFKLGITAATGGIFLVYMASMLLGMFGIRIPMIHEAGIVGIGFSMVVVVIAALNLVLDFDFIENGVEMGAPKYMEWFGAFGLMVTLVWLYMEILHLLAKLNQRD